MKRTSNGVFLPFHTEAPATSDRLVLPDLSGVSTVYADLETDGLKYYAGHLPVGQAIKPRGRPAVYLAHGHRGGGNNISKDEARSWARREMRGKRICNIRTKFDLNMYRAWGVDLEEQGCTFHDVAHDAALLDDHRRTFNLEELAQQELGIGKLDPGVPKAQIADAPAWMVGPYACRDVELVEQLDDVYEGKLRAEGLLRVRALEDEALPAGAEMEWNGVPIDEEKLHAWRTRITTDIDAILWKLWKQFGFTVHPDQDATLERVWRGLGLPITTFTPKPRKKPDGTFEPRPSFKAEVIEEAARQHPALHDLVMCSRLLSVKQKFLDPYPSFIHKGKIHGNLNQLATSTDAGETKGTVSGRWSMSEPNLQQVLAKDKYEEKFGKTSKFGALPNSYFIRELFREPDGYWFCADQAQVEYRVFTHYSNSERLLARYREDPTVSFHKIAAGYVHAVKPDMSHTGVKILNFLSIYGGGVDATAKKLGVSNDEAEAFRSVYFGAFPEAKQTLNDVKRVAKERGYVMTILGRRSRFPVRTFPDKLTGKMKTERWRTHKALNCICQGTAADLNKRAMIEIHKERKALGFLPRLTVHDELNGRMEDPAMAARAMEILNYPFIPMSVPILWTGGVPDGPDQSWANAK